MQCSNHNTTLEDRIREMRQEDRALVPWKLSHAARLRAPRTFARRYLTESVLERTIERALPDIERELEGIVDRLARRLGSRRLARDLVLAAYESVS